MLIHFCTPTLGTFQTTKNTPHELVPAPPELLPVCRFLSVGCSPNPARFLPSTSTVRKNWSIHPMFSVNQRPCGVAGEQSTLPSLVLSPDECSLAKFKDRLPRNWLLDGQVSWAEMLTSACRTEGRLDGRPERLAS